MDTLFEFAVKGMKAQAEVNKLCHRNGPVTSREAAEKMVQSGALNNQEETVLRAIKLFLSHFPYKKDFTAKDLRIEYLDYYIAQRRLSGLRNKGKIERTGQKRDGCCVWRLI